MNWFHSHEWDVSIYLYPRTKHQVRKCRSCGLVQSQVRDVNTRKEWWINGNIWSTCENIFIVCDTKEEFRKCYNVLKKYNYEQSIIHLDEVEKLYGQEHPIFYFVGKWWEIEEIIADPRFTNYLNNSL
jgi:hypothetical protein